MKYTKATGDKIIAAFRKKNAPKGCPLCGTQSWTLGDGIYFLTVQKNFPNIELAGAGMPCAAIICQNCGNTHLLNLIQLGLGDLLK